MDNLAARQPATAERPVSSTREEILKEAKRIEESALYSSKGHFAAAEFWTNFHLWIGIPTVVLAATGATFTFSDSYRTQAGILALVVAVLSSLTTFLNPNERAGTHSTAGNNYNALRNKTRIFWTIDCWREHAGDEMLTERLKDLSDEVNKLNQSHPQIPGWAYKIGKTRILAGEGTHMVDKQ